MSKRFDAKEATECLIEWIAQTRSVGFKVDVSPTYLTKMAVLDIDALETTKYRASYFPGLNLESALLSAASHADWEDSASQLVQGLLQRDDVAVMVTAHIEKILNKEFEQSSIATEEPWQKKNIFQKAYAIAQHRDMKKFDHLPKPADYSRNKQKYEFKVTLMMLKGGDSSTLIGTRLFFSYNVLFHSFLRTLQDETQLSIIPPLRINQELVSIEDVTSEAPKGTEISTKSITTEAIGEDDKAQNHAAFVHRIPILTPCSSSVSQDGEPSADDRSGLRGPNDSIMDTYKVTALNNGPQERSSSNDRGYTLEHGPWSYYVVSKAHPAVRPWVQLVNINDYAEMLDTLKRRTNEDPQDEISAIMMHSMEVVAVEERRSNNLKDTLERNETWSLAESDGSLGDDDDGKSEPYFEWLSRTLRPGY